MEILDNVKIIWDYLRKYKKAVIKTALLAIILSTLLAFIPYVYGRLVDAVFFEPPFSFLIIFLLGIWILMSLSSAFFKKIVSLRGTLISVEALADLVHQSASNVINLP